MLNIESSENPSRGFSVSNGEGGRVEILRISCNIRPANGMYLNIDVMDSGKVQENLAELQQGMAAFISDVFARAAAAGLPVPAFAGDTGNA